MGNKTGCFSSMKIMMISTIRPGSTLIDSEDDEEDALISMKQAFDKSTDNSRMNAPELIDSNIREIEEIEYNTQAAVENNMTPE